MNDVVTMNEITLDNGENYLVLDKIPSSKATYVYLAKEDYEDILLRKRIVVDGSAVLEQLDDLQEIRLAFSLFFQKHSELLEESLS